MSKMLLNRADMALVPDKVLYEYGAKDADATYRILKPQLERLKEASLLSYYENFIIPLSKNLLKSSLIGIKIDRKKKNKTDQYLTKVIESYREEMEEEYAYEGFNPNSPNQVSELLFDDFKLPVVKETTAGGRSTDEEVLEILFEKTQHPFVSILREYRKLTKLKSTYIDPLEILMDEKGYIHPNWRVSGARTGRVTSQDPGTTTVPRDKTYKVKGEEIPLSLRSIYSCPPGHEVGYYDKRQGELRCMAIFAGDEALLSVLKSGRDPHNESARECLDYGKDEEIPDEVRVIAKAINFGLIYGASDEGLAANTGAEIEKVREFIARHKRTFPDLHEFINNIADVAFEAGHLESAFGRRKHVVPVARGDKRAYSHQKREFINFLPQNTCAEITAGEFNRICDKFRKYPEFGAKAWPFNLVYDSVQIAFKKEYRKQVEEIIREEALKPVPEMNNWVFPIKLGFGGNWSDAEQNAESVG